MVVCYVIFQHYSSKASEPAKVLFAVLRSISLMRHATELTDGSLKTVFKRAIHKRPEVGLSDRLSTLL